MLILFSFLLKVSKSICQLKSNNMSNVLVDVLLSLSIERDLMIAHLQFSNVVNEVVYLDEETICYDNDVSNIYFLIVDERGKEVAYRGMMGKRPIDPEFFVHLKPGEKIETEVNLSEVYDIKEGGKYTIKYSAHNPYYMDVQEGFDMESNKVEILYA